MEATSGEVKRLDYFISEKHGYVVVCFIGEICRNAAQVLELCQNELAQMSASRVVLSFHYVTDIEGAAVPALVQFQMAIRSRGLLLRVCQFKSAIKRMLLQAAAIRYEELRDEMSDALQSFVTNES